MAHSYQPTPNFQFINSKLAHQFAVDTHEEAKRVSICPVRNEWATKKALDKLGFMRRRLVTAGDLTSCDMLGISFEESSTSGKRADRHQKDLAGDTSLKKNMSGSPGRVQ